MAKTIIGVVTSNKADKTIVITAQTRKTHPLYRKQYTINTKYMAHDEKNEAEVGDKVSIIECRPLSARKHFTLAEIIEKPVLREDSLSTFKSEDSGKKASKSKAKDEDEVKETEAESKAEPK
jgi:small subunit ribosomal protein S17